MLVIMFQVLAPCLNMCINTLHSKIPKLRDFVYNMIAGEKRIPTSIHASGWIQTRGSRIHSTKGVHELKQALSPHSPSQKKQSSFLGNCPLTWTQQAYIHLAVSYEVPVLSFLSLQTQLPFHLGS
jgi:hypothetical protein